MSASSRSCTPSTRATAYSPRAMASACSALTSMLGKEVHGHLRLPHSRRSRSRAAPAAPRRSWSGISWGASCGSTPRTPRAAPCTPASSCRARAGSRRSPAPGGRGRGGWSPPPGSAPTAISAASSTIASKSAFDSPSIGCDTAARSAGKLSPFSQPVLAQLRRHHRLHLLGRLRVEQRDLPVEAAGALDVDVQLVGAVGHQDEQDPPAVGRVGHELLDARDHPRRGAAVAVAVAPGCRRRGRPRR